MHTCPLEGPGCQGPAGRWGACSRSRRRASAKAAFTSSISFSCT